MKEKIFAQLKLACGTTTSISDRTLDKLATTLSATITEETQIPAAIELQKPFLQELDGNINFVAANAVKNAKPSDPPAPPTPPTPTPTPDPLEPAWFTKYKEDQIKLQGEMAQKLSVFEKTKATEAMVASARTEFFKKYKISDSEKALCEKALALELKMNQHETADTLIAGWKTQYEDFRSASGLGSIEPVEASSGNGNAPKPILEGLKSRLQREGKLPKAEAPTT